MNKASHSLGINIGGTQCSLTLGTPDGRILERRAWPTAQAPSPRETIARIQAHAQELTESPGSAGVAIGGPLDAASGRVLGPPNLPGWNDVPLREWLEEALGIPVRVAHDAAACALAEARWGSWDADRLVYLTCGTGFGAGIVQSGQILSTANGLHPEIGHWRICEDGPMAFGRAGSAEALCSARGLGRIAAWRAPHRWPEPPEPARISALSAAGDPEATGILDLHASYTGRVCAMVAELLCPDLIVLGSLATHIGPPWTSRVQAAFQNEVLPRIGQRVRVEPNALAHRLQDLSALVVAPQGPS